MTSAVLAPVLVIVILSTQQATWPADYENACLEQIFSSSESSTVDAFGRVLVDLRFLDRCGVWYQLELAKIDDHVQGSLTSVRDLYSILAAMRRTEQGEDFSVACRNARLQAGTFQQLAPELLAAPIDALEDLRTPPIVKSALVVHGDFVDLRIRSGAGAAKYQFYATRQTNQGPLQEWVYSVLSAVGVKCESK